MREASTVSPAPSLPMAKTPTEAHPKAAPSRIRVLRSLRAKHQMAPRTPSSSSSPLIPSPVYLLLLALLCTQLPDPSLAQSGGQGLSRWFYNRMCPDLETVVLQRMRVAHQRNPEATPSLLRMFFHDCFVGGCDASILLNSDNGATNTNEKAAEPNLSLVGFNIIDDIKTHVEQACPGVVSCADILTIAARDSIRLARGPTVPVLLGRRDGVLSLASRVTTLPSSRANFDTQLLMFQRVGLNLVDLVTLSGAHTFGMGRCVRLAPRFPPNVDTTINATFRNRLMKECKFPNLQFATQVAMDQVTPLTFDNQYYINLLNKEALLVSDAALLQDPRAAGLVQRYAKNQDIFFRQFARSLLRMSQIQPRFVGEIRRVCSKTNVPQNVTGGAASRPY